MKKLILLPLIFVTVMFSSCSVQKTMSSALFIERIQMLNGNIVFDTENAFFEDGKYICFAKNENGTEYIMEFETDESGNAKKICLACRETDKAEEFKLFTKSIIKTYSPDDDTDAVISELSKDTYCHCDTQWHRYSAVNEKKCLFFSVESKKLATSSDAELTLKQNDII